MWGLTVSWASGQNVDSGAGDVAQVIECLPSMRETLGLIPSTT